MCFVGVCRVCMCVLGVSVCVVCVCLRVVFPCFDYCGEDRFAYCGCCCLCVEENKNEHMKKDG